MYEQFYGLRELPFDLTPNPRYLLLTHAHREALSNLEFGIRGRVGITVLVGEAGTGKTTLVRTAMARVNASSNGSPMTWAYLKNPTLSQSDFLRFLATSFGLLVNAELSKTQLIDDLERMVTAGRRAALIVDEAQSVPLHLLEEIRLLANIESDTEKLLPVLLVGQPELANRLNEPALRQLKQRVALRCSLAPLTLFETGAYIAGRIEVAGGEPGALFSREAVLAIYKASRGIPRTISVICANALLTGYADDQRRITRKIIEAVCRDFDLPLSAAAVSAAEKGAFPGNVHSTDSGPGPATDDRTTMSERARGFSLTRRQPGI